MAEELSPSGDDESDVAAPRRRTAKAAQERRRVVSALFPETGSSRQWWFRYAVMMGLSAMIAVMGLSMNSSAVVIGAMLIAPLMTPVLGISASLIMGWPNRLRTSAEAAILGSVGAVALSWFLTSLLPTSDRALTTEVLSRTSPDLRDLIVALAAGAAGAFAIASDDVSATLPGVAVAVALIPPLGVVGFSASIGRFDLARGALLLFIVNLLAIVVVGALVFLAKGFVPVVRYREASKKIKLSLVVVALALVVAIVPLTSASLRSASEAATTQAVNQAVVSWLSPYPSLTVSGVAVVDSDVKVVLAGPDQPPPTSGLIRLLKSVVGPNVGVRVQWFQTG